MLVAVLSDIHDHVGNLDWALAQVQHCARLICCGDLCSPFIIDQLGRGFAQPIDIVWGNNDADQFRMTAKLASYPQIKLRGEFFEDDIAARRIAVNHFDTIARAIARGQQHDAVFFGHNHIASIETFGRTLALNPGSLMGCQFNAQAERTEVAPSYAIWDAATNQAQLFTR